MTGTVALGREQHAAADDREPRPTTSGTRSGSERKTSAIATATSGAAPTVTDVREAPTSRTREREEDLRAARCEQPGEQERPRAVQVETCPRASIAVATSATRSAGTIVASAAPEASTSPASPRRRATVIEPKSAAEARARTTAVTRALRSGKPAPAQERRAWADHEPVAPERAKRPRVERLDSGLGAQPFTIRAKIRSDPHLSYPCIRERSDSAASPPRLAGRADDDLPVRTRELREPDRREGVADRPVGRKTPHPKERRHHEAGDDRRSEDELDRSFRLESERDAMHLVHVVVGQNRVDQCRVTCHHGTD